MAAALNGLGHIAMGHSLEEVRRAKGDEKLRKELHEDATIILDLVAHEAKRKLPAIRHPVECEAALSQFRDLVQSIDFDDVASMTDLKTCARHALEAFGVPMPA
ncbi:hypothetical protein [Archangium lansingense]|uniref:Uncharacterized protein n=1 Tax=Archangium lansingense TaxID=2995310 RepID=A0ABT4A9S6_9BACT|nr:hypothetical protein [Archangium lansinium]MCY1078418.1 hypothetical protein [Archangium lansinium]